MSKWCTAMLFVLLCAVGILIGQAYADPCFLDGMCLQGQPCSGTYGTCKVNSGKMDVCVWNGGSICCERHGWTPKVCTGTDLNTGQSCKVNIAACETLQ
jgi:hypothetical protein